MASQAKLVITVGSTRGGSRIAYSTKGRYISLAVNGLTANLAQQPIQPTASPEAFWASVLAIVGDQINPPT